ncbi:hypothetical protein MNEG_4751, partial [Monoraphidium neglectum]
MESEVAPLTTGALDDRAGQAPLELLDQANTNTESVSPRAGSRSTKYPGWDTCREVVIKGEPVKLYISSDRDIPRVFVDHPWFAARAWGIGAGCSEDYPEDELSFCRAVGLAAFNQPFGHRYSGVVELCDGPQATQSWSYILDEELAYRSAEAGSFASPRGMPHPPWRDPGAIDPECCILPKAGPCCTSDILERNLEARDAEVTSAVGGQGDRSRPCSPAKSMLKSDQVRPASPARQGPLEISSAEQDASVKLSADDIPTCQILERELEARDADVTSAVGSQGDRSRPSSPIKGLLTDKVRLASPARHSPLETSSAEQDASVKLSADDIPTCEVVVAGDAAGARLIELGGARSDDVTAAADEGRAFEATAAASAMLQLEPSGVEGATANSHGFLVNAMGEWRPGG